MHVHPLNRFPVLARVLEDAFQERGSCQIQVRVVVYEGSLFAPKVQMHVYEVIARNFLVHVVSTL